VGPSLEAIMTQKGFLTTLFVLALTALSIGCTLLQSS